MRRKSSADSSRGEEDPLQEEPELETSEPLKSNDGLLHANLGSLHRSLAVLAAIGSVILVALAIVQGSTLWFNHKHIENQSFSQKQSFSTQHSNWVQGKQQLVFVSQCKYDTENVCPALALFHNPEVHEVATENLMKVGHKLVKHADRNIVKLAVAAGFKNISYELQIHAPEVAEQLVLVELSEMQKNAVLESMRLMSNPLVQSIGRDIGQAIHDSKSIEREDLKRQIHEKLQPRLPEIMKLHSELVPEFLRQLWSGGHQWIMTLDKENIRVMGPYNGEGKYGAIKKSTGNNELHNDLSPLLMTTYSILGGVLEEGRALLDIIELCGHFFGRHVEVPYWVTYLGGNMEVTSEFLSCEHHFVNSNQENMKLNSISTFFCPLKFGTQGMDALKAAFAMDSEGPYVPDAQFALPSLEEVPVAPPLAPQFMGTVPRPRLRIVGA